jgi:Ku protein
MSRKLAKGGATTGSSKLWKPAPPWFTGCANNWWKKAYYLVPDGEVGQQAFAVIREAIRKEGMVALGRVVFTSREHVIALEPRGKGLLGMTLRYPYEVRKEDEYFGDIPDEKIPKDMLELASHIVETKSGHFEPEKFEDQYEDALKELLKKKQAGEKIEAPKERAPAKVINLMDALRRSVEAERGGLAVRVRAGTAFILMRRLRQKRKACPTYSYPGF